MIGHVISAYCHGRRCAWAGRLLERQPDETDQARRFVVLGFHEEQARMREAGQLPQLELALDQGSPCP